MLAKAVGDEVPDTPGLLYEPKWDGFRCIVFREDSVVLQSRKEEDFSYLFPEVVAVAESLPPGTTLDGELVIVGDKGLEFDLLSNRIRPRSEAGGWKIKELSEATPARFVAFDILRHNGDDISQLPFAQRREILESLDLPADMHLTPITDDPAVAREWFNLFEGAGLDGVVCKPADAPYTPGKRTMLKVKHVRTAGVNFGPRRSLWFAFLRVDRLGKCRPKSFGFHDVRTHASDFSASACRPRPRGKRPCSQHDLQRFAAGGRWRGHRLLRALHRD